MNPHSIDERLQIIRMLNQGLNPEQLLERRLEEEQQAFEQSASRIQAILQERQTEMLSGVEVLVGELESMNVFKDVESQNQNLHRTLDRLMQTQKELQNELGSSQKKLHQIQVKKIELTQSLQSLKKTLKSPEAKSNPFQDLLYSLDESLNKYISKNCN